MTPTPVMLDLSHWQAPRPLFAAKAAGIRAVVVKATQGKTGVDPAYGAHCAAALEAELLLGAYHFGTGKNSGDEQARNFLRVMRQNGAVPRMLVLDLEHNPAGETMDLQQASDFLATLEIEAPHSAKMLYGGSYLRELRITGNSRLAKYPLWLADYRDRPSPPYPWADWSLWQYTDGVHGPQPRAIADLGARDYSVERTPGLLETLWSAP